MSRRIVGVVAVLYAIAWVPTVVLGLRLVANGASLPSQEFVDAVGASQNVVRVIAPALYFGLWWLARPSRAAWLFLVTAVLVTFDGVMFAVTNTALFTGTLSLPIELLTSLSSWAAIVAVASLALGLWLYEAVPRSVAWIAWALAGLVFARPVLRFFPALDVPTALLVGLPLQAVLSLALAIGIAVGLLGARSPIEQAHRADAVS